MFRVIEPHAVRHPETGDYVVPGPTEEFAADDPLVKAYPWLFIGVESATAAPGERRALRRASSARNVGAPDKQ